MRDFNVWQVVRWLAVLAVLLGSVMPARAGVANLDAPLDIIRQKLNLPGAAAVVMQGGAVVGEGVTGVRRLGTEDKIRIDDRFGIGSCTKRMTGLMIGRLIDEGILGFDTTLSQTLTDVPMRDEYRAVTMAQLLTFTGGIPTYERIGPKITPHLFDVTGTAAERQTRFIRTLLQETPVAAPGKEEHYSNASYSLAAYVAATAAGKDYGTLMQDRVFGPLGLKTAGWGRPWAATRRSEPWLHIARPDGYVPEPDMERPPEVLFQPAGGAHMSMRDLATFARYELLALRGRDDLLKPATSARWHGNKRDNRDTVVIAGGTPWLSACYLLWPQKDLVAAFAVNGGSPGDEACQAFVKMVKGRFDA